jgi:hypothetical protein
MSVHMLDPERFSRNVLASLSTAERRDRLSELEQTLNQKLAGAATLAEFQERLYQLIDGELIGRLGYSLGRWEYDCEVECWGGPSYMDSSLSDELLLRSEFPHGVRLAWGEFEFLPWA